MMNRLRLHFANLLGAVMAARFAKDGAFLAEMECSGTEVGYRSGVEMERLMARIYAFPPALVERMVEAISSKSVPR